MKAALYPVLHRLGVGACITASRVKDFKL